MDSTITLNHNYSTTRLIIKDKSKNQNNHKHELETTLFLSESEERQGEGGLRTQGYFKMSYDKKPLVSIVTVVFNGEAYLEETIQSVINQTYDNVEYIIIDGGSTDGTLEIIKKYENQIDYWVSEKDTGMYNALNKGFSCAQGEYLGWINSDDTLFTNALQDVQSVFIKFSDVKWLTGRKVIKNKYSQYKQIGCFQSYYQNLIKSGFYRGDGLWFIMQEGTFWRRTLFEKIGFKLNEDLKLAADFELWTRFAKYTPLYSVNSLLGSFRMHENQLSSDREKYSQECNSIKFSGFIKKIFHTFRYFIFFYSILDKKNKIEFNADGPVKATKFLNLEGRLS